MNMNLTDITIILDQSGSMEPVADDTIGGFNAFLKSQRELPGECRLSLVKFNHARHSLQTSKPIKEVVELTRETYQPNGMTALLDAIGVTIDSMGSHFDAMPEADRPGKVMVVIITDGLENSSKYYSRDRIFERIKQQTEKYSWQFIFLGANQDAIKTGASYGIAMEKSMTYAHNSIGTRSVFDSMGKMSKNLRAAETTFDCAAAAAFDADDRKAQQDAGAKP